MHTVVADDNGASSLSAVPAFLAKLWRLLEDPETDDLICWSDSGMSFYIRNQARFARQLLPLYYKHNNMASFVRQLNMYGFRKVTSVDQGSLRIDKDEMEFQHNYFVRGHEYLLENIKRKLPSATRTSEELEKGRPEVVKRMLSEVRILKGKQDSVETRLANMKRENEALWREVASLRQKHFKQQQIVNKLIQFLVTLVQRNDIPAKRRYPLAIQESADLLEAVGSKQRRMTSSKDGPIIHDITDDLDDVTHAAAAETSKSSPAPAQSQNTSVISEASEEGVEYIIEHQIEDDHRSYAARDPDSYPLTVGFQIGDEPIQILSNDSTENPTNDCPVSPAEGMIAVNPSTLTQPNDAEPTNETEFLDVHLMEPDLDLPLSFDMSDVVSQGKFSGKHQKQDNMKVALTSDTAPLNRSVSTSREDLDNHLESFELELDGLKNLISLQNVNNFDASTLLSVSKMALSSLSTLFDTDDSLHSSMPMPMPSTSSSNSSQRTGNELMTYNPMLDLGYDDHNFFGCERDTDADSEFLLNDEYLTDIKPSAGQLSTLNTPVHTPKSPPSFGRKKK